jgi:hypothetical protein
MGHHLLHHGIARQIAEIQVHHYQVGALSCAQFLQGFSGSCGQADFLEAHASINAAEAAARTPG